MADAPADFDQTRFPVTDNSILEAAKKLAEVLRQVKRLYLFKSIVKRFSSST